jgi:hypothetical protein
MKTLIKIPIPSFLIALILALVCIGLSPKAQALNPPPDGGYPGGNTAEGQAALASLTTGTYNTAVGVFSLLSNTTNSFNTGVGAGTLLANTADENTATGAGALLNNTTAAGNTADGAFALFTNTTGSDNTAVGQNALLDNTTASFNTAIGWGALAANTTGHDNTAVGLAALFNNTTGTFNICVGSGAGSGATTANNSICIGANGNNVNNSCYIGQIFGATSAGETAVFINASGQLGTLTSSKRFKEEIKPMEQASEVLLALKPVTFRYKKEIDPARTSQFGLVAEEVEKVNRDLVVRDKDGKPYSVRYEQVNAMLLNEFLKEHRAFVEAQHKVEKLEGAVADLVATVKEQAPQIQRVSVQLEMSKPAPRTVLNNQ